MKKAVIIGAGFSGLSLAHELVKRNFAVEVVERESRVGGMISSPSAGHGFYETAANGFMGTQALEDMLNELQVPWIEASNKSRKRFIYRNQKPRQWPLNTLESFRFIGKLLRAGLRGSQWRKPQAQESIEQWGLRILGPDATQFLLGPALQGIYAGDIQSLSASLVLGSIFKKTKKTRALISGSQGMGSLMELIKNGLLKKGVQFHFQKEWRPCEGELTILCTSAFDAAKILSQFQDSSAQLNSEILKQAEGLPLISVTAFFAQAPAQYLGFGILFPRVEGVRALGVLMNSVIYDQNLSGHSETWIFGGALDKAVLQLSDLEIKELILRNRQLIFGESAQLQEFIVTRWPTALPFYSLDWEKNLRLLKPMRSIFLHGNYLGSLGLSRILERSQALATELETYA